MGLTLGVGHGRMYVYRLKKTKGKDMSMTPDQYIEAKKNAMRKKTERKLWLESKIAGFQRELEEKEDTLRRDQKVIDKIERMKVEYADGLQALERAKAKMQDLPADMLDEVLDGIMKAKNYLDELEARIRAVYYSAD